MNLNNVIRQGDSQPREYQLDTGNLDLNLTNKSATIRLMTADFRGIGYETTATVSSENRISFSIDDVIPARQYRLEVTVDDYVFPSRATDGQFNIDPSSHGQEVNIINVIGKEEIVRDVKARVENELEPFLGDIEQAELDRQAQEEARETAEGGRGTAEAQRKLDHANRSAELDSKADKTYLIELLTELSLKLSSTYVGVEWDKQTNPLMKRIDTVTEILAKMNNVTE